MTSPNPDTNGFDTLVSSSRIRQNRRDILRIAALSAAAAAMPLRGIYAQDDASPESTPDGGSDGVVVRLPFNPYGQEVSVDPHRAVNWGPFWVMLPYAWSGLLRFDENGAVESDLAESVEPNEDGSVWTATLREGITFADGTPITAEHFLQSWNRALDSTRLTPMARFFTPIVGANELAAGENTSLGVNVVDDRTLEISLTAPLAHFPSYLATFGFAVVHPEFQSDADQAVELSQAGSGPWSITSVSDTEIVMQPNPNHWDSTSPDISQLVWAIAPGGNTDLTIIDWYQSDAIAIADAPLSVQGVLSDEELENLQRAETQSATLVLTMDFHQEPFNDVRVRRAVAAAINREAWATEIEQQSYVPANSFSPPVLAQIANYEAPTDAYDEDPAELLDQASFDPAASENEIIVFQPATDSPEVIDRTAQLLTMISDATGIQLNHDVSLTAEQIEAARQDSGGLHISTMQWQLDSDQPSLLQIMSQQSDYNAGWVNWAPELEDSGDFTPGADAAAFDELVSTAATTLDEAERNASYAEAETLLLRNAVIVPIGFWAPAWLQKPWLTGTRQGPWSGSTPVRLDAEVTVDREAFLGTPEASTPDA